jgi:putative phosphoribosyl transferase
MTEEGLMLETPTRRFTDRRAAGRDLAERLRPLAVESPVVLGLARGGVPVAYEVAQLLGAPLDVLVVRKIGAPGNPELGIGAIAEGDVRVLNQQVMRHLLISGEELEAAVARARAEVEARVQRYRNSHPPLDVKGHTAIVVDDGLATGGTARAALRAVRAREPRKLILAVPVGAPESVESLREEADEVICLLEPELMWAVGLWYEHFQPTSDGEIAQLLAGDTEDPPPPLVASSREVRIPAGAGLELVGDLVVPESARGLVVFAHGSGSSRHSPRNRQVARALNDRRLATLLLDLLTADEERNRANVFDIALLADRLVAATRWAQREPQLAGLRIGYFGASTGAGAALWAAAELGEEIGAVVSRGGRPDLAAERLGEVRAPVQLIVGAHDEIVLELNEQARTLLQAPAELAVVPRATHLFEEPGALEEVSRLAGEWFQRRLARAADGSP